LKEKKMLYTCYYCQDTRLRHEVEKVRLLDEDHAEYFCIDNCCHDDYKVICQLSQVIPDASYSELKGLYVQFYPEMSFQELRKKYYFERTKKYAD